MSRSGQAGSGKLPTLKGRHPNKLLLAWDSVLENISRLSKELRSMPGCRDVVITICIRNGERIDTYSVPQAPSISTVFSNVKGNNGAKENNRIVDTVEANRRGECNSIQANIQLVMDNLEIMNTKEIRSFFSGIRKRLGLSTFKWPQTATKKFVDMTGDPVPAGPGRASSGKRNLILILKLSMASEEALLHAAKDETQTLRSRSDDRSKIVNRTIETHRDHKPGATHVVDLMNEYDDKYEEVSEPSSGPDIELETALEMARSLPLDTLKANARKSMWVSIEDLVASVSHPKTLHDCEWFVQSTPPDGNCMFSAILTTAKIRSCLPNSVRSISDLRSLLRHQLEQLSMAGNRGSSFRREWLAVCVYDIENKPFENKCNRAMDFALQSCSNEDIETFLSPLRIYVSNWAKMVGNAHWGGLLSAELSLIANILGAAIEVLQPLPSNSMDETSGCVVRMCDTRRLNDIISMVRRTIHYPTRAILPSPDQKFLGPIITEVNSNGWVGPYPVLRLTLRDRHYDACTSIHANPISLHSQKPSYFPYSHWFSRKDTLVEPYAALNGNENYYLQKAQTLLDDWRVATNQSVNEARHADCIVMHTKCTELTVSALSHLQVPPPVIVDNSEYMLSDEIMTCYMSLLQTRSNSIIAESVSKGIIGPPKCRFLDSWFYKSISRGPSGPSSRKQRADLNDFPQLVIPALVDTHWVLAVCYVQERLIGVYDPLHSERYDVFNVVRQWAEMQLRSGDSNWRFMVLKETRGCLQKGGVDCGIYVCKAAESLGLGIPIRISQWDIEYVRKRMMVEFIRQQATKISWPRK